jgi:predicted nucleic acid-binding protein
VKRVFADAHFFIAFFNSCDGAHDRAVEAGNDRRLHLVKTRWVLVEFADAMASPAYRVRASAFLKALKSYPSLTILEATDDLFEQGCVLFADRQDKAWSLTDCISFAAMKSERSTEALTGDRHFEQAGFTVLLK